MLRVAASVKARPGDGSGKRDDGKNRSHFKHRIDMLDEQGEILEHLAGVDDFGLAEETWRAAVNRWPKAVIILRQDERILDSPRIVAVRLVDLCLQPPQAAATRLSFLNL